MDLIKRCIVPLIALILGVIAVINQVYWLFFMCLAIVLLGLHDWVQPNWTITRNYPVAGRIRWLFLTLRPYLHSYIVEDDLSGTPFSYEARKLVTSRARSEIDTHPFGTEHDTSQPKYHWINHSVQAEQHPDTSPRVHVGNEQTGKPYAASIFNISAMSFGALSSRAIEALNIGAKRGGFYHDTGEGGISNYHLKHGGDIVWELGSGYFGARDKKGHFDPHSFKEKAAYDAVKMIEIKSSQGAKPGHGGLLPAKK